MTNIDTPPAATRHTVTSDAVTDAVPAELAELHRIGVTRAQAVDSLHTVANELIQPLITPTPGPAQRSALACADTLRAAATGLAVTTTTPASGHPPNSNTTTTPPRTPQPPTAAPPSTSPNPPTSDQWSVRRAEVERPRIACGHAGRGVLWGMLAAVLCECLLPEDQRRMR